jgi:NADPH:quinone reductase-like Zn-dependent oxidoreductase
MTKIVRFHRTGGPEVLQLDDVELAAPGPGELRLRIMAIGLNRADAAYRSGRFREPVTALPSKIGYEASGLVEAIGNGVTGFSLGEPVSTIPAFAQGEYGVYGEAAIVPARFTTSYPSVLSFEQGAAIWMQYLTAWGALVNIANIGPGTTVLVPAATSSVGLAAIQIAKALGAIPIALTRTSAKRAALEQAVPGTSVVFTAEQDLVAEIMRLTDGKGAQVAFDPVGGSTLANLTKALASRGILIVYGMLDPEPALLPTRDMMSKGLSIRGYGMEEVSKDAALLERAKQFVIGSLESGVLRPILARTFPLAEIVEAHRYLESNAHIGKLVVRV